MLIKTKKYSLSKKEYIKMALKRTLLSTWWVFILFLLIVPVYFFYRSIFFLIIPVIGMLIYVLFWFIQFYGVTIMDQASLLFEKVSYEISAKHIIIQLNNKQGMPLEWKQIKKIHKNKDGFIFIVSRAHLIFLPYKIFSNMNSVKMLETLLKRKRFIK